MKMRKLGLVAAWLACAATAHAEAPQQDKEVWITIGSDALPTVRTALQGKGQTLGTVVREKGGVSMLRVRESQVLNFAGAMHDKLNRCAGFVVHDTQEEALAAVDPSTSPRRTVAPTAISYLINNGPSVNALMNSVQELNIRNTVNSLSTQWTNRYYNAQGGANASTWLKSQWTTIANGRSDITVAALHPQLAAVLRHRHHQGHHPAQRGGGARRPPGLHQPEQPLHRHRAGRG